MLRNRSVGIIVASIAALIAVDLVSPSVSTGQATTTIVPINQVRPVVECREVRTDGQYVWFGYQNDWNAPITIPVSPDGNKITPAPQDRGQSTVFAVGRQRKVFAVELRNSANHVWTLKSPNGTRRTATGSTGTSLCPTTTTTTIPPVVVTEDPVVVERAALRCAESGAIRGTAGADVLVGTPGDDVICGFGGADAIQGFDGRDTVYGGAGDDVIDGGDGRDYIFAMEGNDRLIGGGTSDALFGGLGNDELIGGDGPDTLSGDEGDDVLRGGMRADILVGGGGNDTLYGDEAFDTIDGGAGVDVADGGANLAECVEVETKLNCKAAYVEAAAQSIQKAVGSAGLVVESPGGIEPGDIQIDVVAADPTIAEWVVGDVLELSNNSGANPTSSTLTFQIPADGLLSEYSIFTKDPSTGFWVPAADVQVRDETTRRITVSLTHFSPYVLVREKLLEPAEPRSLRCISSQFGSSVRVDLLIDASGSTDLYDPVDFRLKAAAAILEELPENAEVNVVEFDSTPNTLFSGLNNDAGFAAALDAIADVGSFGGAKDATSKTLDSALSQLAASSATYRTTVLISDGELTDDTTFATTLSRARSSRLAFHVIDLQQGPIDREIYQLATETGGIYSLLASGEPLSEHVAVGAARKITDRVFDNGLDRDSDGLSDCTESFGALVLDNSVPYSNSTPWLTRVLDVTNPDQDDDGLPDGLELASISPNSITKSIAKKYLRQPRSLDSSPLDAQSDGDGVDDYTEWVNETPRTALNTVLEAFASHTDKEIITAFNRNNGCDDAVTGPGDCARAVLKDHLDTHDVWKSQYASASLSQLFGLDLKVAVEAVTTQSGDVGKLNRFHTTRRTDKRVDYPAGFVVKDVTNPVNSKSEWLNFLKVVTVVATVVAVLAFSYAAIASGTVTVVGRALWLGANEEVVLLAGGSAAVIERITGVPAAAQINVLTGLNVVCQFVCDDDIQSAKDTIVDNIALTTSKSVIDSFEAVINRGVSDELVDIATVAGARVGYLKTAGPLDLTLVWEGVSNAERVRAGIAPVNSKGVPFIIQRFGNGSYLVTDLEGAPIGVAAGRVASVRVPRNLTLAAGLRQDYVRAYAGLPARASLFSLDAKIVGFIFEANICGSNARVFNSKTFDCFNVATGLATSSKTLNFHRKTYLRASAVRYRLRKYVDEGANYEQFYTPRADGRDIIPRDINFKELVIGVPAGNVPVAMQRAFDDVTAYGTARGVTVRFVTFD